MRRRGKRTAARLAALVFLWGLVGAARAETPLEIQQVAPDIYALVGELGQRSPENHANNSTHGVIVTPEGVILIDPGGSWLGARQIDETIRTITDRPVKIVIDTGGQDHRWLGNGYFKERGARIIASEAAAEDQRARADYHFARLSEILGDGLDGTEAVYPDETFAESKVVELGGVRLELYHAGPAHTVGDSFVWLPTQKVMFAGDIVFTERALGTGPADNVKSWLKVFETMAAYRPEVIVPGHGHAGDLATATRDTYDYLRFLREQVGALLENGGDMLDSYDIDQSEFSHLKLLDRIGRRNAQAVYGQMEFE